MQAYVKRKIGAAILAIAISQIALADSTVQQAQEALKEQGYYYGQVTGDKNADTTAAIRRFQIRNGLKVTGELNEETLRALNTGSSSSAVVQSATPETNDLDSTRQPNQIVPATPRPHDGQFYQPAPAPSGGNVFSNTPYEVAPPELQQRVILGAQTLLRRRGFYKSASDGVFGPDLEFSLRAFQSHLGIPPNGHLDMDTLAALGLLPGQHGRAPMEMPRRRILPSDEPPVHGEWIH